jgi:hypothetical protein
VAEGGKRISLTLNDYSPDGTNHLSCCMQPNAG